MNKIYKTVWNAALSSWVAVSEVNVLKGGGCRAALSPVNSPREIRLGLSKMAVAVLLCYGGIESSWSAAIVNCAKAGNYAYGSWGDTGESLAWTRNQRQTMPFGMKCGGSGFYVGEDEGGADAPKEGNDPAFIAIGRMESNKKDGNNKDVLGKGKVAIYGPTGVDLASKEIITLSGGGIVLSNNKKEVSVREGDGITLSSDTKGISLTGGGGITLSGGNKGISVNKERITNLADGTEDQDAVTKSQLQKAIDGKTTSSLSSLSTINSNVRSLSSSVSSGLLTTDSHVTSLSSGLSSINSNVGSLSSGLSTTSSSVTSLSSGLSTTSSNVTSLSSGLSTTSSSVTSLSSGLSTTSSNVTSLSSGLSTTSSNVTSLSSGLSTTSSNVTSLSSGLSTTNSHVTSLSSGLSSTTSNIGSLSTGLAQTNSSVASLSTSTSSSVGSLSTSISSIASSSGRIGGGVASALGGGATYDPATGTFTAPTYTTHKADGTTAKVDNVGDALDSINSNGIKYFHTNARGKDSIASGVDSIAIGPSATANADNSVAIGKGSIASAAMPVSSATIGGSTFGNFAGSKPVGTVNIGAPGFERQLTGLAAGRISTGSTDAVNGSQLFQTNAAVASLSSSLSTTAGTLSNSVASLSTSTAASLSKLSSSISSPILQGSLSTGVSSSNGSVSSPSTSVGSLSTGQSNSGTTLASLSTGTSSNAGSQPPGTSATTGSLSTSVGATSVQTASLSTSAPDNATRLPTAGGYAGDMSAPGAKAPSVTTGSNSVALGQGSTDGGRSNVVSVGSAAQQRQITHVAPGTEGTDAVNLNQLNAVSTSMSQALAGQQNQLDGLGTQVRRTADMARRGIAAVGAMASIPQLDANSNFGMGLGTASFAGQKAIAVNMQARISDNLKAAVNGGFSGGQAVVGAGMLYQWK
ncbi:YadA-like family protein [Burkholderia gladioli]|uniref:YadA-like family protein n=1 Tax=Burkholderia gladioli TaxID=28095 RepID=UPI00163F212A|nr:YadA-like family protein [Burkholderia gladioli]